MTAYNSPGRPYSGPDQLGGNAGRSQQLQVGATGDPDSAATATARPNVGLTADSLQWRAQTPTGYRPSSILTPIGRNPGGNGMSAGDAARRWADGTPMGSVLGTSESSFEPAALLRQSGLEAD